jgi:hypothetical protein
VALRAGAEQPLGGGQVGVVVVGETAGRALGGQALELGADEEDVAALVRLERPDQRPTVSQLLDQPDRLQLTQRLADRRAADAEPSGEVLLAQPGAERDAPGDDLDLQLVGEVVGTRRAACGSGRRDGSILSRGLCGWEVSRECILRLAVWIQTG